PIEEGMRETLENDLAGVDELLSAVKPRRHRYPILSVEPLTWRDEQGYPKLVIMALDQPGHVEIRGDGNSAAKWHYLPLCDEHKRYSEVIKRIIVRCYRDVGAKLVAGASNSRCERQFIRMELGKLLIPPETREKISKARKFFDDQIFLIAEAGKWVEGKVVLPKPDPLIVGYEDGLLFLIDIFDLKRIEDIARSEFVVPQPKELK
ncbi:MAG: hypothetical protein Q8Q05_01270, partial [bacterium]|nr:hypothetical protein [bacterium]